MPDITYTRTHAQANALDVSNNGSVWSGLVPSEEAPTRLWLRIPDTSEGVMKLMEYNWDQDSWAEVIPE